MPEKKLHPETIRIAKRKQVFSYWLKKPDTTNKELAQKFKLSIFTISHILTQGLQSCKQK